MAEVIESLVPTPGQADPQPQASTTEKYHGEAKPQFVDWRDATHSTIRRFAKGKWADWRRMPEEWGNQPDKLYPWNDPIHKEGITVLQMNIPTIITYWASIEWQNNRMVLSEQHEKEGTIADYVAIDIPEDWLSVMKEVLWPPPSNGFWYT
jgi:hypothetical protein